MSHSTGQCFSMQIKQVIEHLCQDLIAKLDKQWTNSDRNCIDTQANCSKTMAMQVKMNENNVMKCCIANNANMAKNGGKRRVAG